MKAVAGRTFATRAQAHEARSIETKLRHETILLANGRGSASEYYLLVVGTWMMGGSRGKIENGATQNGRLASDQQASNNVAQAPSSIFAVYE